MNQASVQATGAPAGDDVRSGRNRRLTRSAWHGVRAWLAAGGPRMGAAVAFYSLFALSPVVVIATAIAGLVFGSQAVRAQFAAQIGALIGPDAAVALERMISSAWQPNAGLVAGAIGGVTLVVGATGVLTELRTALDAMLGLEPDERRSAVGRLVRARVAALALVLGFGFLLIMSLMFSAVMAAAGVWLSARYPTLTMLLGVLDVAVSLVVLGAAFGAIIRWLPSAPPPLMVVAIGALLSAVLFTTGKYFVSLYLAQAAFVSAYGAAGSLAVLLFWVYFTCQLLLLSVAVAHRVHAARSLAPQARTAGADRRHTCGGSVSRCG